MKIWKNTATLDSYTQVTADTVEPELAEIAVLGSRPFDHRAMPNLKGVFKCGVGLDNLPIEELKERNIALGLPSNETRRYIYEETANYAVYLILCLLYREVGDLAKWTKAPRVFLGNRTVLVVGAGNIGSSVSEKLKPMCRVLTYDVAHHHPDVLREALPQADVVTLHIPSIPETKGFVGTDFLAQMKDGAGLVNTARGAIVDEDALYGEIKQGRLCAAFDVFWEEPYKGKLAEFHPDLFWMSPHVASANETFLQGLAKDFEDFIQKF
ncbi:NAD(P)-dependent oxidoreductase [Cerasicoccus arenae]|uniref:D-isomer specific 2-hydroxyacid dehydrogenase NAD-binding domain-containing protein n=1 Tax=Cerasicoccus arenae TaxID=424488 RepID=A0A8J3DIJ3_9BACT|nr:NAD(P)-dependent oxidoreductase [Cerasicoccus arenae]MBK1858058.1 hypothetical protein [Cerasicoccus arenae]GHC06804.1 hypothetical protein GCM10007047_24810 [Cerasicoccus arenae]